MLPVDLDTIRLFLHVTAAAVWVGGQFTVAGLLGTVRALDPDAPRAVARAFARIAWPPTAYSSSPASGTSSRSRSVTRATPTSSPWP
jgi:hypothetical protein